MEEEESTMYLAVGGLRASLCGINGKLVLGRKLQEVMDGIGWSESLTYREKL